MANDTCAHCPRSREEHMAAEREGVVRHKFSADGALDPVTPGTVGKPPAQAKQPQVQLTPADPVLRFVLIEAGVITPEQLTEAENKLRATGMLRTGDVRSS